MPKDVEERDFGAFTCGLSEFRRRDTTREEEGKEGKEESGKKKNAYEEEKIEWKNGKGIKGGWTCVRNSDCTFLKNGGERGWYVYFTYLSSLTPFIVPQYYFFLQIYVFSLPFLGVVSPLSSRPLIR